MQLFLVGTEYYNLLPKTTYSILVFSITEEKLKFINIHVGGGYSD